MAPTLSKQSLGWIFCQTSRGGNRGNVDIGENRTNKGWRRAGKSSQEEIAERRTVAGRDPGAPGVEVKFNPLDHGILTQNQSSSTIIPINHCIPKGHIQTPVESLQLFSLQHELVSLSSWQSCAQTTSQVIQREGTHRQKGQMCHRECPGAHIIWKRSCLAPVTGDSLWGRETSLLHYWTAWEIYDLI